jgi:hypothetical protein
MPGLLEDAIAQGMDLSQVSPLFAPSANMQVYNTALAAPSTQYGNVNPLTGRQWGEYNAIYQNNDTDAQMARDAARTKILAAIGSLDPDVQPTMLRQSGFAPPKENLPPDINGLTPTDALMRQIGFGMGAGGEEGFMGSKLRNLMYPIMLKHQLDQPNDEMDRILKMMQIQNAHSQMQSQDQYRKESAQRGMMGVQAQFLGLLDNLIKARSMATVGGDTKGLERIDKAMDYIMQMSGGAEGLGISSPNPSGAPVSTTNQVNPSSIAEEATGQPWWDRQMPSNQQFIPDLNRIATIRAQIEHAQRFAPGDVGTIMALQRQLQDALTPPLQPITRGRGFVGPNQGATANKGIKVTKEQ